jgi:hypothetical protein
LFFVFIFRERNHPSAPNDDDKIRCYKINHSGGKTRHASSPVTTRCSNNFCGVKRSIFVVPEIGSKIQTFNGVIEINAQTLQGTVVQQTTRAALQHCRVILMPSLAWTLV